MLVFGSASRSLLLFLVDFALILQRQGAWQPRNIDPLDSLNDVFAKESQSLNVAAHLLRDSRLFEVHESIVRQPPHFVEIKRPSAMAPTPLHAARCGADAAR